jgi:hypothetical protein
MLLVLSKLDNYTENALVLLSFRCFASLGFGLFYVSASRVAYVVDASMSIC